MNPKTIILQSHPDHESFCNALAQEINKGTEGFETKLIHLEDSDFDVRLRSTEIRRGTSLDPEILGWEKELRLARHLVIVAPLWWGTLPAVAWGYLQRVLRVETAYGLVANPDGTSSMKGLLTKLKIHLIVTSDSDLNNTHPVFQTFIKDICPFIGATAGSMIAYGPIRTSSFKMRGDWLKEANTFGRALRLLD